MTNEEMVAATPSFLENPPELLLFGGKGGVGKTSCATATALKLAGRFPQKSFLLVSTDPAHSLLDCLATSAPFPNLTVLELETQESLNAFMKEHGWKLREIALRGTFLDEEDIKQFLDLSLPGLDELLSFLEIAKWVNDQSYDCIVVDTAPTGHTLRLLAMPQLMQKWLATLDTLLAKHRYMKKVYNGFYRRDMLDDFLEKLSASVKQTEALLQAPRQCLFVPVMLPEVLSIIETLALLAKLKHLKIPVTEIIVNRLFPETGCPACAEGRAGQIRELRRFHHVLSRHTLWSIPLRAREVRGLDELEALWNGATLLREAYPAPELLGPGLRPKSRGTVLHAPAHSPVPVEGPPELPSPDTRFLIFAGKGGVGKTTLACSTAVRLAQKLIGKQVLLFSTDPAHSLSTCLEVPIGAKPTELFSGLTAIEIDAQAEFDALKSQYTEELQRCFASLLPNLDLTFDREVMERVMDLSPPGLDEVIALIKVTQFFTQDQFDVFILDSAPTGHLIRLLEMPEIIEQWFKIFFGLFLKYRKVFHLPKISERMVEMSKGLKCLRKVLADSTKSALYAVSILTEMSFEETKDLLGACDRMRINVPVLFLNLATPAGVCSFCGDLYQRELLVRNKFRQAFSGLHQTIIYRRKEPLGIQQLSVLAQALYNAECKESLRYA